MFIITYPLVIATSLLYYFDVHSKVKLLTFNVLFSLLNLYLVLKIDLNMVYFILFLSASLYICIEKKNIKLKYFAVTFFLVILHPISLKLAIAIVSLVTHKDVLWLFESGQSCQLYFGSAAIGNAIMIFISYLFINLFKEKQSDKQKNFSLFTLSAFFLIVILATSSASDSLNNKVLEKDFVSVFLVELVILMMFCIYLYYEQVKSHQKNIEMSTQLMTEKYHKQMFSQLNYMSKQINSDKHMMLYHLIKINQMLSANKVNEANEYVNEQIQKISQHHSLEPSYNPLFDELMTTISNEFKENNIELKLVMSIEKENLVLNSTGTLDLIKKINSCILKQKENISLVEFFFEQNTTNIKMRVNIHHDEKINLFDEEFYKFVNTNYTTYFEGNKDFDTIKILL